jgi:signal transduction protein with GAF and PtsI domain
VIGEPRSAEEAERRIVQLEEEVDRLAVRLADDRLETGLRDALRLAATAGRLASPVTHSQLLRMIVETAAHVIAARGGALLLVDEEREELVFEVAFGSEAEELAGLRLPLGHGIAGLVAVSGQPMAISDAESDPRVASDVAQTIGYVPQALLCVPLLYDDRVIGVLELVDKEGGESFSGADIESLVLFANQAAVAIRQSRIHHDLATLIGDLLASLDPDTKDPVAPHNRARALAEHVEGDEAYRRVLSVVELVQEIAGHGEDELRTCQEILQSFAAYLRSRPRFAEELGVAE